MDELVWRRPFPRMKIQHLVDVEGLGYELLSSIVVYGKFRKKTSWTAFYNSEKISNNTTFSKAKKKANEHRRKSL